MHALYRAYGHIPRLMLADGWCFEGENHGKPALAGGSYCFIYEPISVIPDQANTPHPRVLSHGELVEKYAQMWRDRDVACVRDYFDSDLHYTSHAVFDEMSSRAEYLAYIQSKLEAIANQRGYVTVESSWDEEQQKEGLLIKQYNQQSRFDITTRDGYITRIALEK